MNPEHDIFTKRGITPPWEPGGHVARAQGFLRYEGADWQERRALAAIADPAFASDWPPPGADPDPEMEHVPSRFSEPVKRQDPARQWLGWLRMAFSVDGWAMPRHAVLPEVPDWSHDPVTQIRPDAPIPQPPRPHVHWQMGALARHQHERKAHGGRRVNGWHTHERAAKYLYTMGNTARRLGTNPIALERGWGTPDDLFVFVMEGTLKMCAVVEAGFPAVDVGSVTLWRGGDTVGGVEFDDDGPRFVGGWELEIDAFAEAHLGGRTVAVVCDSDWDTNDAVRGQTQQVVGVLEGHGARAIRCAPPSKPGGEKRGVDDWLGEGRDLLDVVVPGPAGLAADDRRLMGLRSDGRQTVVDLLTVMGSRADADGIAAFRKAEIARDMGRSREALERAIDQAVNRGLATEMVEARRRGPRQGMAASLFWLVPEARPSAVTLRSWLGL